MRVVDRDHLRQRHQARTRAPCPSSSSWGSFAGGWQLARSALVARTALSEGKGDKSFYEAKIKTARFYADHVLTQAPGLRNTIVHGAAGVMALTEEQF